MSDASPSSKRPTSRPGIGDAIAHVDVPTSASTFGQHVEPVPGLGRRGFAKHITLGEHGILMSDEPTVGQARTRQSRSKNDPAAVGRRKEAATIRELGTPYIGYVEARRAGNRQGIQVPMEQGPKGYEVAVQDIRRFHRVMSETPYLANRLVAMLGAFLAFAEREGPAAAHESGS